MQTKPLSEVFDLSAFSKPTNFGEVTARLRNNVSYFKTNYAVATLGVTAFEASRFRSVERDCVVE